MIVSFSTCVEIAARRSDEDVPSFLSIMRLVHMYMRAFTLIEKLNFK